MAVDLAKDEADEHVRIERTGAAAIVTLARPAARNALSIAMRARLMTAISGYGRDPSLYAVIIRSAVPGAFSVGGDVREMTALAAQNLAAARQGLADELRLCWVAECTSKPTVSLIDGQVMGTGVGISLYNTHRVAGERYTFSMPETQIGYFPDCGVARAFGRMPAGIGLYLGLTGAAIGPADALALGLVTHVIPAIRHAEIEAALVDADPIDPLLDERHVDPGPPPLMADAERIARFFGAPSLAEILARLRAAGGADRPFADEALATLAPRSPLALAVTDRMIRRAGGMSIDEALAQDWRLAYRFLETPDFGEGVRAFLRDRDRAPKWSPARPEDVTETMLDRLFAPLGEAELGLASRAEMQADRV